MGSFDPCAARVPLLLKAEAIASKQKGHQLCGTCSLRGEVKRPFRIRARRAPRGWHPPRGRSLPARSRSRFLAAAAAQPTPPSWRVEAQIRPRMRWLLEGDLESIATAVTELSECEL
jgi:hypothetical protein